MNRPGFAAEVDRRWRRVRLVLAMTSALVVCPVLAQEAVSPTPSLSPTPDVVPQARIAENIDAAREQERKVQLILAPTDKIRAIEAALPDAGLAVQRLAQRSVREATLSTSSGQLADLETQWRSLKEQLQTWQRTLSDRAQEIDDALAEVQALRDRWGATRDAALKQDTPPELLQRIDAGMASFDETIARGRQARADLLTLQGRVAQGQTHVDDGIDKLAVVREELRRRLWANEDPPLWDAIGRASGAVGGVADYTGPKARLDSLLSFASAARLMLALQLAAFVSLVFLLRWLQGQARGGGGRKPLASVQRILRRPVSAALLISLVPFRSLHPLAPAAANELAALIGIVPVLRLLPRSVFRRLRLEVLMLSGLYAFNHVVSFAPAASLGQRLLLLTETVLAAVAFALIFHRNRRARLGGQRRWRFALPLVALTLPLLAVSIVANLLGSVLLARLLTTGVIDSGYIGLALFTAAMVLDGVLGALLYQPLAQRLNLVRHHGAWLRRRVIQLFYVLFILLWLSVALGRFGIDDNLLAVTGHVLDTSVSLGSITLTLRGIFRFAVTLGVAMLFGRAVRFVLEEDVLPRTSITSGAGVALTTSVHYLTLLGGFLLAVAAAGVDFSNVAILAGALSVGIGFGLQNVVNNFVSGLILLVERPVSVGDTVEIGTVVGSVRRIGIRSSTIRTFDGADVIVPNGDLLSERLVNWTFSDRFRRIEVAVGVAYGTDPRRVIELLAEAASRHAAVLMFPKPSAVFIGFGDSSLNFSLRFWTGNFDEWVVVRSDVSIAINDALQQAGIEIPFPQRDVHLKTAEAPVTSTPDEEPQGGSNKPA